MPKPATTDSPVSTIRVSLVPMTTSVTQGNRAEQRSEAARKAWATRRAKATIKATADSDQPKVERAHDYSFGAGI